MKKTKCMVISCILFCCGCILFVQMKVHSMAYAFTDIQGDRSALVGSEVTLELMSNGMISNGAFLLTIKDGTFSYRYKYAHDNSDFNNYLQSGFYTEDISFDDKDLIESKVVDTIYFQDDPDIQCIAYQYAMDIAYLEVNASLKDETGNAYYNGANHSYEGKKTQLYIQSTPTASLIKTRTLCDGGEQLYRHRTIDFQGESQGSINTMGEHIYQMNDRYYGMLDIQPSMEGIADIYRFDVESEGASQKKIVLTSVQSIPITKGTRGFLYQYQDRFYTILMDTEKLHITAYDASFQIVDEVHLNLPWEEAKQYHTEYINEDYVNFYAENTLYTFSLTRMEFVDSLDDKTDEWFPALDVIYRNHKYYMVNKDVPKELKDKDYQYGLSNQIISVYEANTCLYRGFMDIQDINSKLEEGEDLYKVIDERNHQNYRTVNIRFARKGL